MLALGAIMSMALFIHPWVARGASSETAAPPRNQYNATVNQDNPQAAILDAEKRFQQAEKEFAKGESQQTKPASGASQKNSQLPLSETQKNPTTQKGQQADPRAQALQGSPETGYSGTWTDPATGDIITTVIAPTPVPAYGQTQNYPIIIEPQVSGYDWGTSGSTWNTGSQPGWPQWPGYPGDSGGYPSPPPPPPGRPWPNPGPMPMPMPGPEDQPPPFPPGYRPLRPTPPSSGWNQGFPNNPGMNQPPNPAFPSNPGFNPPPNPGFPNNPAFNPEPNPGMPGAPGFNNPGMNPNPPFPVGPSNPGLQPGPGAMPNGPAPGFRPLPMAPGGNTWHGPHGRTGGFFGGSRGGF